MPVAKIRPDLPVEGLSGTSVAERHRMHRRTLHPALTSAMPPKPGRVRQSRKIERAIALLREAKPAIVSMAAPVAGRLVVGSASRFRRRTLGPT